MHELKAGGPGKDGIPAIHRPAFLEPERAARGIGRDEPAIALDRERIATSREVGSTGVFERRLGDETLTFKREDGQFHDEQTQSTWDITGKAVAGPLKGQRLAPVPHGDYFAFSWLVFKPEAEVYRPAAEKP